MKADIILGLIRHVLTLLGGYYVARGALDQGTADTAVGAITALVGIGWSIHDKSTRAS